MLIFDLYGTIVDMQAGLTEAAAPYLKEKGWDGAPHRFVTWWRRTHFENSMVDSLCDRGHTSYRTCGSNYLTQRRFSPDFVAEERNPQASLPRLQLQTGEDECLESP